MTAAPAPRRAELVPLAERLRWTQVVRALAVAAIAAVAVAAPETLVVPAGDVIRCGAAYIAIFLLAHGPWRRHARGIFSSLLILDGVFLVWSIYATGWLESPIRYMVVLHLIAVALLASSRTAVKLSLWHSLLLWAGSHAQAAEVLVPAPSGVGGGDSSALLEFVGLLWLVALAAATLAAVNERELRRHRYDLEALAALAAQLEQADEPDAIGQALVESVAETFGCSRVLLLACDERGLSPLAGRPAIPPAGGAVQPEPASVLERARALRRTVLVSGLHPEADPWLAGALPDARAVAVVPLSAEGQIVGLLVCEHGVRTSSRVGQRIVTMVERFAAHTALALRNAMLLDSLRRAATTDGLTGAANRRTFETALERDVARAARHRHDVALVMFDVDHFKRLNDTYGHQTGDEVLRAVARVLGDGCRQFDTLARYGGEEFAMILPATGADDAVRTAERLLESVRACAVGPPVTASAGVAVFPLDAADPQALVAAADAALYAAKHGGRNQVRRYETAVAADG